MLKKVDDAFDFDVDDGSLDSLDIDNIKVLSVTDALALPETGASSAVSSCNSCSSCGSSSCFEIS